MAAGGVVLVHLGALGTYVLLHELLKGSHLDWLGAVAAAMAVWHVGLGRLARGWHEELPEHLWAVAATLGAVAICTWTDGPTLVIGWAVEASALAALELRREREWLRLAGAALVVFAAFRAIAAVMASLVALGC
jgi:hypothetical protein